MLFHTQDFMEMQELLRESSGGDVAGTSDPSTPRDQQRGRGQRVRISRGCGTGGRYDLPNHRVAFFIYISHVIKFNQWNNILLVYVMIFGQKNHK